MKLRVENYSNLFQISLITVVVEQLYTNKLVYFYKFIGLLYLF